MAVGSNTEHDYTPVTAAISGAAATVETVCYRTRVTLRPAYLTYNKPTTTDMRRAPEGGTRCRCLTLRTAKEEW